MGSLINKPKIFLVDQFTTIPFSASLISTILFKFPRISGLYLGVSANLFSARTFDFFKQKHLTM